MHYTGTIWRPPYEAPSLLLEVTAGCTHHKCKFCSLYHDLPFKFRMSPLEDVERDLQEAQLRSTDPISMLTARLQGMPRPERIQRAFLTGANPFVLTYERLTAIADLIHRYIPSIETIGCFARITDVALKSDEELASLHRAGYDGLTIGIETGDDEALRFMDKGYTAADIVTQCQRLDQTGIHYALFYLAGISGAGRGEIGANATAAVCGQLHPTLSLPPAEQGIAQLFLQGAHASAGGGLGDIEGLGPAGDAPGAHHRQEALDLLVGHRGAPSQNIISYSYYISKIGILQRTKPPLY